MSILFKMKSIKTQQKAAKGIELYQRHPLEATALDIRLQYLSALALLTALDRELTADETNAFAHLGQVLNVDASETQGYLDERSNFSEDDIALLFAALREQNAAWNYLADLAWLQSLDAQVDAQETQAFSKAMQLLGVDAKSTDGAQAIKLAALMLSLQSDNDQDYFVLRSKTSWSRGFETVLSAMEQKLLKEKQRAESQSFNAEEKEAEVVHPKRPRELQYGFIDNLDGTITNPRNGLMWKSEIEPGSYTRAQLSRKYSNPSETFEFAGYSDWRVPTIRELKSLFRTKDEERDKVFKDIYFESREYYSSTVKYIEEKGFFFDSKSNVKHLHLYYFGEYGIGNVVTVPINSEDTIMDECSFNVRLVREITNS